MSDPVVAICIPVYHDPGHAFWRSFRHLWVPGRAGADGKKRPGKTHVFDIHDHPIVVARTNLLRAALDVDEVTHVLWVDADMSFPPDALERLLAREKPIVGGLCFNRRSPYQPTIFRRYPPELARSEQQYGFVYHYQPGLNECDATGTGFLLVERQVFEAVEEQFGRDHCFDVPFKGQRSEDLAFCARAKACGFPVYVDADVKIGHEATVIVDEAFARKNRPFEWEAWVDATLKPKQGEPAATIVIPTYNQRPNLLRAAIDSARSQTVPVEIIVVDDGSDDPASVPDGVRLIRHEQNRGIAAALNSGIDAMSTDWWCWLSSDDLIDPRKIQRQRMACESAGIKASFHRYQVVFGDDSLSHVSHLPRWGTLEQQRAHLAAACVINGSTVMIHRDVFDAVGKFSENYLYSQDWEMFARIGQKFFWYALDEILGTRREHDNLTAAIDADAEKRAIQLAEDQQIRAKYAPGDQLAHGPAPFRSARR